MSTEIKFLNDGTDLVIKVPIDLLVWASENNPEFPIIVKNKKEFAQKVLFELQHNLGSNETGFTGFQILLDAAVRSVAENGEKCVELIDELN